MASSSSWLGVFSPRISRMLVGWKAIIPSSWSKLCAPRRGRGRRGTAEQIARAHTFLFFFLLRARLAIAGTDRRNCCVGGGGGWWRANLWKTLTDTRLSSTLYWRWRRTNTALTVNRKVGDFHQGHVSPGFVPEARARRLNRPSLIVYYAGKKKCCTAFIIPRPIALYYGAKTWSHILTRLEHGMQLHHAKLPQVIGSKKGLKGENCVAGWSEKMRSLVKMTPAIAAQRWSWRHLCWLWVTLNTLFLQTGSRQWNPTLNKEALQCSYNTELQFSVITYIARRLIELLDCSGARLSFYTLNHHNQTVRCSVCSFVCSLKEALNLYFCHRGG